MPRNYSKNKIKVFFTILQLIAFIFIIVYADQLSSRWHELSYVNRDIFVKADDDCSTSISTNCIATVELDNQGQSVIQYVVKAWDSLSKIASDFWTTISHIQKINNLSSWPIKPWDKIIISQDDEWILYELPEKTSVLVFANKYNLSVQDFMTINSIQDDSEILQQWQELFIPISIDKAYDIGLLIKPEPKPQPVAKPVTKPTIKPTPTITSKPKNNNIIPPNNVTDFPSTNTTTTTPTTTPTYQSPKILSERVFKKEINNKFAPWNCTWYVAAVMPNMFPYIDEKTQDRPFGWNAKDRYKNASAAWYKVWKTPRAWSIVVYGQLRSPAWHVWIVDKYNPDTWEITVRDMNYKWKYVVTIRTDSVDNSKIIWYIYP